MALCQSRGISSEGIMHAVSITFSFLKLGLPKEKRKKKKKKERERGGMNKGI